MVNVGKIALKHNCKALSPDFNCLVTDPEYVNEILDKLNGSKLPAVCQDLQDITALTRITAENELLLMVCNLNFDELESLKVRCAQRPSKVLRLTCDGVWEECSFSGEGEVIHIDRPMGCYDLEVFKLN